ncbi:hypothetical protein [Streptomyces sp. NBC_00059]|uniref:hypothetical protein n=1 Tax=Streptomyces sp. NBC_00059 TaxID=2975635 RepID=UPI0022541438|nr:hypothetical protein [Streptomyces sp. NBC_00059]MCX5412302.1 hypothetical protein [Streptomyces sp. NBC_00059]
MLIRTGLRAAIPAVILGALLTGCSAATTTDGPGGDVPYVDPSVAEAAAAEAEASLMPTPSPTPTLIIQVDPNDPELVRDAFAGLQATLYDNCTPGDGNCAYFLGRVNEELNGLDKAMKADKKGPEHFEEPIAWIGTLRTTLDGDTSTPNLEKHRSDLLGTRGRVNTWMQGHPEDYR